MSDLVKRLRAVLYLDPDQFAATGREAADAIEELTAALRKILPTLDYAAEQLSRAHDGMEAGWSKQIRTLLSKYGASNG